MAQDITLLGASYEDVPAVELPKTGGGIASFTDITDTTAEAADVAQGKYFYGANGVKTMGTASSGVISVNGRTGVVTGLQEATTVVNKTSSDTSQTLAENTFYIWETMSALTITCPATGGEYAFRFTSGSTPTTLTMTGITMPDSFSVEANRIYEINVLEGYGVAQSWSAS